MAGPTLTPTSTSNARRASVPNATIPRPPNPWILFRAVKLRELNQLIQVQLNTDSKLQQAIASKLISQMWKDASKEERKEYEELAKVKKAEHKAQYPTYRFQPKKKGGKSTNLKGQMELYNMEKQANGGGSKGDPLPSVPAIPGVPLVLPLVYQPQPLQHPSQFTRVFPPVVPQPVSLQNILPYPIVTAPASVATSSIYIEWQVAASAPQWTPCDS